MLTVPTCNLGPVKAYVAVAGLEEVWGLAGGPCRAGTCLSTAASIPPCLQEADMKQILSPVIATAHVISLSDPSAALCAKGSIFPLPTLLMQHAGKHVEHMRVQPCVKLALKNVLYPSAAQWVYNIIDSVCAATTLVDPPPSDLYNTVHESIAKELLKQHIDFEEQPKHCQVQLQTLIGGSEIPTGAALCMQEEPQL